MTQPGDFHVFRLRLGSACWRFAAAPELEGLARLFARILCLAPESDRVGPGRGAVERTVIIVPDAQPAEPALPAALFRSREGERLEPSGWEPTRQHQLKFWRRRGERTVILQVPAGKEGKDWVPAMSAACLPLYLWAAESGGFPLHAALLGRAGEAVALAAAGGTGKSTAAGRVPKPWRALGDDLALVVPGEAGEASYMVHPLPTWSDYAFERSEGVWRVEERLSLRAVFFLSRAAEDAVLRMGRAEAAIRISQSVYQILVSLMSGFAPAERRSRLTALFDNASRMTRAVPVFTLEASLTGSFWREIERVL